MSVTPCGDATRSVFDAAADAYDAARPSYPAALFDELEDRAGPLAGRLVLDWGAGTGIASRQLAARGARVVSLDIGEQMLRRALFRSPGSACVLADGNQMPVRSGAADLATFAQAWHWFANPAAIAEVARVLKPGGYWAAWWNRTDAAGEGWFDSYQNLLLARCPGYNLQRFSHGQMAPDWHATSATGDGIAELAEMAESAGAVVVPWTRQVSTTDWITDDRSKSWIIELGPAARQAVLDRIADIIGTAFPDGQMRVPYVSTLLLARKAG
jgi:SAM-dependent methyltransferase